MDNENDILNALEENIISVRCRHIEGLCPYFGISCAYCFNRHSFRTEEGTRLLNLKETLEAIKGSQKVAVVRIEPNMRTKEGRLASQTD